MVQYHLIASRISYSAADKADICGPVKTQPNTDLVDKKHSDQVEILFRDYFAACPTTIWGKPGKLFLDEKLGRPLDLTTLVPDVSRPPILCLSNTCDYFQFRIEIMSLSYILEDRNIILIP